MADTRFKDVDLLIVENDPEHLQYLRTTATKLEISDAHIQSASTFDQGVKELHDAIRRSAKSQRYLVAIIDQLLGDDKKGIDIVDNSEFRHVFKIMCSDYSPEYITARDAALHGAGRFIPKHDLYTDPEVLEMALLNAIVYYECRHVPLYYESPEMDRCLRLARVIARRDGHVLVRGQSGTGKEIVAQAIHLMSGRSQGKFRAYNCAGFVGDRGAVQLWGVAEKVFPEVQAAPGIFEVLNGGTVFLDEVGYLPPHTQGELLRFVQDPTELYRIGSTEPVRISDGNGNKRPVNVRIIFATDKNIRDDSSFSKPLYNRISKHKIELPPLNERKQEIPGLVRQFIVSRVKDEIARRVQLGLIKNLTELPAQEDTKIKKEIERITVEALDQLGECTWEGQNVRGLQNTLAQALDLAESETGDDQAQVTAEHVKAVWEDFSAPSVPPQEMRKKLRDLGVPQPMPEHLYRVRYGLNEDRKIDLRCDLRYQDLPRENELLTWYRLAIWNLCSRNIKQAAKVLGIERATLYDELEKAGYRTPTDRDKDGEINSVA